MCILHYIISCDVRLYRIILQELRRAPGARPAATGASPSRASGCSSPRRPRRCAGAAWGDGRDLSLSSLLVLLTWYNSHCQYQHTGRPADKQFADTCLFSLHGLRPHLKSYQATMANWDTAPLLHLDSLGVVVNLIPSWYSAMALSVSWGRSLVSHPIQRSGAIEHMRGFPK